ncbi:ferric reductase-like transmembrane domain-containing protein [Qipengyuania sp. MTN3-11]|uniref:ferric reductase-like transmembrane domain-containing protein n=1 Tax=Qipengyuania sp. MTN3-11 TaxID=3056557 RepID=UPI0036F1A211
MPASRAILWLVLALPGIGMLYAWNTTPDDYGYGHIIKDTGKWAAWLLMATLAVTPIRLLSRRRQWSAWLMRRRRDLGVASFAYALGHTIIYLTDKASVGIVLEEAGALDLLTGWIAFLLFLPLALTSSDVAVRALKRAWKRLHRLVYPAAVLTFLHWVLTSFDPTTAYAHIAVLAVVEIVRVWLQRRPRGA